MRTLTEKQREIYGFIAEWISRKGYPPTQSEIREHFGFGSPNSVRGHLSLIEKKGYIRLESGKARGIQLVRPDFDEAFSGQEGIPLLGRIAAGVPIWAEQNFKGRVPVSPSLFGGGELFALRVAGDSMTGAGIEDGDIAVVRRQCRVENGEIGAVMIDGEATLKRVCYQPGGIVLKPENHAFEKLEIHANHGDRFRILGLYRGIVRTEECGAGR